MSGEVSVKITSAQYERIYSYYLNPQSHDYYGRCDASFSARCEPPRTLQATARCAATTGAQIGF